MNSFEILLGLLGLPLLGGWMLLFALRSRSAIDRQGRDFSRSMLQLAGWILLLHVPFFAITLVIELLRPLSIPAQLGIVGVGYTNTLFAIAILLKLFGVLGRALICLICVWGGLLAGKVSRHDEREELSSRELTGRDDEFTRLYTLSLALVCLPLLLPGFVLLLPVSVVLLLEDFFGQNRRVRENQLLWTLSLAAQHNRPLGDELRAYALSLAAEEQRVKVWVRWTYGLVFRRFRVRYLARVNRVANDLEFGVPLGRALLGSSLLSPDLVSSISTAERTGSLSETLPDLAERHTERLMSSMSQESMVGPVCYLLLVGLVSLSALAYSIASIVPQYRSILDGFNVELPAVTTSFIRVCEVLVDFWILLLPLFALGAGSLLLIQRLGNGNHRWLRWLLRWFPRMESPQLLNQLASAVSRSSVLSDEMESLASIEQVAPYRSRLERLQLRLTSGDPLPETLRAEGFITSREAAALTAANRLDHLPWTLHAISRHMEQRRRRFVSWIVQLGEPLMIILLGLFVLFYSMSMLMPLVSLLNSMP